MNILSQPLRISNSDFIRGVDCERRLWLDRFRPDLRAEILPAAQERIDVGIAIGKLARHRYPQGILVRSAFGDTEATAALTQELLDSGASCLFGATFMVAGQEVRVDVLSKGINGWSIDEVKSSSVKEPDLIAKDKILDIAFQVMTVRRAGFEVGRARLVLVDTSWTYGGDVYDANWMLGVVDVTERCESLQPQVESRTTTLLSALQLAEMPKVETNTHCKKCDYFDLCFKGNPFDVIHLPRISPKAVMDLRGEGFRSIEQIPGEFELTEPRRRMRDVVVSGKPHIGEGLDEELAKVKFPAAFIDYESVNPAFPAYRGTRPYEQICFQWSAHIMDTPDSEPVHFEFLPIDVTDPRPEFCRTLWEVVSRSKSIVYYTHFELTQLRAMEKVDIPLAAELVKVLKERTVDLEKIVKDKLCYREFMGRSSLKVVLPVLVPTMSYKEMLIADGTAAGWGFRKMLATKDVEEREKLRAALLAYCCQDTLAMVEIYRALKAMV